MGRWGDGGEMIRFQRYFSFGYKVEIICRKTGRIAAFLVQNLFRGR
jgi:hypothetical protein